MYSDNNYISFSYRAYDEDTRDTDMSIDINFENADDAKLAKRLNTWLRAIESTCEVTYKA